MIASLVHIQNQLKYLTIILFIIFYQSFCVNGLLFAPGLLTMYKQLVTGLTDSLAPSLQDASQTGGFAVRTPALTKALSKSCVENNELKVTQKA